MVDTVSSIAPPQPVQPTESQNNLNKLNADFDFFIKMLSAQLQNQDPLDPQDPAEFTQQLVQYSAVEQQIATNDKLQKMLDSQQSANNLSLLGYLGRAVEFPGNTLSLQSGSAGIIYTLAADANTVQMEITDGSGRVVRVLEGGTQQGQHAMYWDGKDSAGNDLADGAYNFRFTAVDGQGNTISNERRVLGVVDRVAQDESTGESILNLGALKIPVSDVLAVRG